MTSLVVAAVLSLALAGAAHALSVDIVLPDSDPAEVYPQVRIWFEAVAQDEQGNDVSERATFTWSFPDAKEPTVGNPVLHRFPELGKFLVSVIATIDGDSGCDETTVIVIPYEGCGVLRQIPEAPAQEDFTFTARGYGGHVFGANVCDEASLVVEHLVEQYELPFEWVIARFYRWEDDDWVLQESWGPDGQTANCDWISTYDPNEEEVSWWAHVELDEVGAEPPNTVAFDYYEGWTPNNTVVKAAEEQGPIILHKTTDTSHTIEWDIDHYAALNPNFIVTVTICDLAGNTVATLTDTDATVGAGGVVWDTNLPAQNGIYTYKIHARHYDDWDYPFYPCVDQDKSAGLAITLDKFYYFAADAQAGTLKGVVKYSLTRAAGAAELRFFGPTLTSLGTLTGQSTDQGVNWSGVYTLTGVQFDQNGAPVGPIYCVAFADESAADGANHRDGEPKPALQKGSTTLQQVVVDVDADIPRVDADPNPPGADTTLKHFVTPKGGAEDVVTLTASMTPDEPYLRQLIDWEGATEDAQDPLKATVPIDAAAKHVVKIKLGGAVVREARVWVVWAELSLDTFSTDMLCEVFRGATDISPAEPIYIDHRIAPIEIVTDTNRPWLDLEGASDPPQAGIAENCWHNGMPLPNGALEKWDASRRIRIEIDNPDGVSFEDDHYKCPHCAQRFWHARPDWPADPAVGNDDPTFWDEWDDPYVGLPAVPKAMGSLKSADRPIQGILASAGDVGDEVVQRFYFQEFTRLELGEQDQEVWYCISDPFPWHVFYSLRKVSEAVEGVDYDGDGQLDDEVWIDNGSSIGLN